MACRFLAALVVALVTVLALGGPARADVFSGGAADAAGDATLDGGALPAPPADVTRVDIAYDSQAGRVDVHWAFAAAPKPAQTVWAGVGLGTTAADGTCDAPDFTPRGPGVIGGWTPTAERGQAVVQGYFNESAKGGVRGVVYTGSPPAFWTDDPPPAFSWAGGPAATLDLATVRPELAGHVYTCARIAVAARDGGGGSVDRLNGEPLALTSPSRPADPRPTPTSPAGAIDADGDGTPAIAGDCDDKNAAIGPAAPEVLGNGVDENCDGRAEATPVVDALLRWTLGRDGERVRPLHLGVTNLRGGETIVLLCGGTGCPRAQLTRREVPRRTPLVSLDDAVTGLRLAAGARLTALVSRPGFGTKMLGLTLRRPPQEAHFTRACTLSGSVRDADCDGFADLPSVTATATLTTARRGTHTLLRGLKISGLQGGEAVALSCRGAGCTPALRLTTTVADTARTLRLDRQVAGVRLGTGARLQLTVARPGFVARVVRWTIQARRAPREVRLCQEPGERAPTTCRDA